MLHVAKYLEHEGYYCSQGCLDKNFHVFASSDDVTYKKYPFLSIKQALIPEIKPIGNIITLSHNRNHSFFVKMKDLVIWKIFSKKRIKLEMFIHIII